MASLVTSAILTPQPHIKSHEIEWRSLNLPWADDTESTVDPTEVAAEED